MAAVVDWLDACRGKNLGALLDFYAESASFECICERADLSGRSALAAYWRPKLSGASGGAVWWWRGALVRCASGALRSVAASWRWVWRVFVRWSRGCRMSGVSAAAF